MQIPADIRLLSERLPPPSYGTPGDAIGAVAAQLAQQSLEKQHGVAPPAKTRDPAGQVRPSQPYVSRAGAVHDVRSHHPKVPSTAAVGRDGGSHVHQIAAVAGPMRK